MMLHSLYRFFGKRNENLIIFPMAVVYVFYYLPVLLDVTMGPPVFKEFRYGFIVSHNDFWTEIFYLGVISFIILAFWILQRKSYRLVFYSKPETIVKCVSIAAEFLSICLAIYGVFSGYGKMIAGMQMRYVTDELGKDLKTFGLIIMFLVLLILFLEKRKKVFMMKLLFNIPLLIWACLMNGKKTIIVIGLAGIFLVVLLNRYFQSIYLYIVLGCGILIAGIFMINVYTKSYSLSGGFQESYESFRIIYGRDCSLKYAIYNELYESHNILEYRGQTLLFYISTLLLVRRGIWSAKPYPYATYFTSRYMNFHELKLLGFTMTTSIVDEFISNFGFWGILLVPFWVNMFCRLARSRKKGVNTILNDITLILGVLLAMLLFAVQMSAFIYIYILFFVIVVIREFSCRFKIRI